MARWSSRLAASGGPRPPGSRAKTNKGASDVSRDFNAGAMLILTVTSAALKPRADGLVPAGDALVPAGARTGIPAVGRPARRRRGGAQFRDARVEHLLDLRPADAGS